MTAKPIPDHIRAAAVADFHASGDSYAVVAARHGISSSRLHRIVNPEPPKKRAPKGWEDDEMALTGGRWVSVRGVMRWEPFRKPSRRGMTDREQRIEWEERMFTEDEAREAHRLHAGGCREPRTVMGERVYQRRKKRAQAARKVAA